MIRTLLTAATILSIGAATPAFAKVERCRDAHGHFSKCEHKAPPKPTRCREHGKFVKCHK